MYAQPTIKDVARVAGVHFTTVSMALRGHPSIPPTTRERIIAAASRIGYQRNQVFAALTNQRRRAGTSYYVPRVAYLANRTEEEGFLKLAHHRMMFEGARKEAEALGYGMDLLYLGKGHHTSKSLHKHLKQNAITGLIIGAFEPGGPSLELDWNEFCTVKIDSRQVQPACTFISTDQLNGVRDAFQKMRERGYRRIGLAIGLDDEETTDNMHLSGWHLEQFGIPPEERIPPLLFPRGAREKQASELLRTHIQEHRIDALLCNWANVRSLIGLAGFECPTQVACAGLCITKPTPGLAGIVSNMDLVGQRVMALLAVLLRSEQRGVPECATNTHVKGDWHDGASAPYKR
jgi:DNA-binding LacI/PurR family transcriptional regulator